MSGPHKTSTTHYQYDPLDRLISAHSMQRFYNSTRIATEIQGDRKTCFFEHKTMPLAELQPGDAVTLLATDLQKSVLHSIKHALIHPQNYSPYGHRPAENGLLSLLGFNGERPDSVTGHYLLGQGHRAYNPVLMRFNSPDRLSPFGEGGINAYAYCENDPINYADPTGKAKLFLFARRIFNQPDVSGALSRVKKSLGSVEKVKAKAKATPTPTPTPTPKKTAQPTPPNTQQTNAPATNRNSIGGPNTRTLAHSKASIAQNRTALAPIHNYAAPSEWSVQLIPGQLQPAVSNSALRPIHNYAAPGGWKVLLVPDPMQPVVRLI
ncbi:RHS repeat-associated core domain-containing protein, partial [Pseudomonas fluorescens]|uniref:RHS repeat-associated core domain-containing protein n=1 Tax=Pseudomonas fluorescens TaxID=294 RepID=UPI000AEDE31E